MIDRLEERDRIESMVNLVVSRVIELQKRDAETRGESASDTAAPDTEEENDGKP